MVAIDQSPITEPARNPKAVAKRIGREYVESATLPYEGSAHVEKGIYGLLETEINRLFDEIEVPVTFQETDPYDNYYHMKARVEEENLLRVYNQHASHPVWSDETNLKFRAVHDWHGHLAADVDFSPEGEFRKWQHMVLNHEHLSGDASRVLFAEVVGQVGAVHYLKDGFASDRFEQRAFMAPERWMAWMREAVRGV